MASFLEFIRRQFGSKQNDHSENAEFSKELEYPPVPLLMERLKALEERRDILRKGFIHLSTEEQQGKVSRISKINEKIDLLNKTIAERTKK